jgi:hypothetical protein
MEDTVINLKLYIMSNKLVVRLLRWKSEEEVVASHGPVVYLYFYAWMCVW